MDIIIFFVIVSLLAWLFSTLFANNRKKDSAAKSFWESLMGGLGIGIIYAIIIALFIICVRFIVPLII